MFPLIIGILLILLGSFGFDLVRRWHFNRGSMANGGGSGVQATASHPRFTNGVILFVSTLLIVAGLATTFV